MVFNCPSNPPGVAASVEDQVLDRRCQYCWGEGTHAWLVSVVVVRQVALLGHAAWMALECAAYRSERRCLSVQIITAGFGL